MKGGELGNSAEDLGVDFGRFDVEDKEIAVGQRLHFSDRGRVQFGLDQLSLKQFGDDAGRFHPGLLSGWGAFGLPNYVKRSKPAP